MENTKSILRIFDNPEFGAVRTVSLKDGPWFIGNDVAEILGYSNTNKAIQMHVDAEDKFIRSERGPELGKLFSTVKEMQEAMGRQDNWFINESGVYSLIFGSKLPNAKRFKHWVTSEVLPAIRQTGGYIPAASDMSDEEIMARALKIGERTIRKQKERIEALEADKEKMRPKAIFADAVSASQSTILIGELAKILRGNGVNIGQNRLFTWMREKGYLVKQGSSFNMPTQMAMNMGLFKIKEGTYVGSAGELKITKTVKVTGKGQQYFINKFLKGMKEA